MARWISLGAVDSFTDGNAKSSARNIAGVTVFYVNGIFSITETRCPHMGYPMSKGTLRNGIVTCAWHKWDFDLEHGGCYRGACEDLKIYTHKIENGELFVDKAIHKDEHFDVVRHIEDAMTQGDTFLLAKILARAQAENIDVHTLALIASKQAFTHALAAHQNLQAIRELDGIRISASFCQMTSTEHYVPALLHGLRIASGRAGTRPQVIPLPHKLSEARAQEMLRYFTTESSRLAIERLLLGSDLASVDLQNDLFLLVSSPLFIHESERLMLLSVSFLCRDQYAEKLDSELAACISWIMGTTRAQASADAQEAMAWLNTHLTEIYRSYNEHSENGVDNTQRPQVSADMLAEAMNGNIESVFNQCAQWLTQGVSIEHLVQNASQLCARRLQRLTLDNGGLWRDAGRGIRLCQHIRLINDRCNSEVALQSLFTLAFYLFESRWLQHASAEKLVVSPLPFEWQDFADAYDQLDLPAARHMAISVLTNNKDFCEFLAILLRDDHSYEQLSTLHAICNEAMQHDNWQPYIAGMVTYAMDQRSKRDTLAAAQFGSSFIKDVP